MNAKKILVSLYLGAPLFIRIVEMYLRCFQILVGDINIFSIQNVFTNYYCSNISIEL